MGPPTEPFVVGLDERALRDLQVDELLGEVAALQAAVPHWKNPPPDKVLPPERG
jgi:hypothetical protein